MTPVNNTGPRKAVNNIMNIVSGGTMYIQTSHPIIYAIHTPDIETHNSVFDIR